MNNGQMSLIIIGNIVNLKKSGVLGVEEELFNKREWFHNWEFEN